MGKDTTVVLQGQGTQPPPSRNIMNQISEERENIYRCQTPKVRQVSVLLQLGGVGDHVPHETDIAAVVRGLRGGGEQGPHQVCRRKT